MEKIFLTGPTKSGKTCLLGSLIVAAGQSYISNDPWQCAFRDLEVPTPPARRDRAQGNDGDELRIETGSLTDLHKMAAGVVRDGPRIEATRILREYRFKVEVSGREQPEMKPRRLGWPKKKRRWMADVAVLDAPGGFAWGADGSETDHRRLMFERASRCQGMIFCVDANNSEACSDFFLQMPEFISKVSAEGMPFSRIAVVLTRADQVHNHAGAGNRRQLESDIPWGRVRQLLSRNSLSALLQAADNGNAQLACGWASAYGFVPYEGTANFDPETQALLTCNPNVPINQLYDSWEPFRVLEPFVFLLSGEPGNMVLYDHTIRAQFAT